jgi:hypothetical protein
MGSYNFYASTDIVVLGINHELADYDNPRGEVYGFSSYVYAEDATGARTRLYVASSHNEAECIRQAQKIADALNNRILLGKLPVAFHKWEPCHSAYGSDAYILNNEEEDLIAFERSLEEIY